MIKMEKRLYLLLSIALLLCGCQGSHWELGDSYIFENGRIDRFIDEARDSMDILIPDHVLNFAYDKNYIIAYQIPDNAIYRDYYIDLYKCPNPTLQSQETPSCAEELLNSMLCIQNCYWIIRKKDTKVYGPMTESDFNQKCKKMNIALNWVRDTLPNEFH